MDVVENDVGMKIMSLFCDLELWMRRNKGLNGRRNGVFWREKCVERMKMKKKVEEKRGIFVC